jgi:hypothetical protein
MHEPTVLITYNRSQSTSQECMYIGNQNMHDQCIVWRPTTEEEIWALFASGHGPAIYYVASSERTVAAPRDYTASLNGNFSPGSVFSSRDGIV